MAGYPSLNSFGLWPEGLVTAYPKDKSFFFFLLFRTAPVVYGSAQTRGQIGAIAAGMYHSHSNAATSVTYTTAQGNAGSLTH